MKFLKAAVLACVLGAITAGDAIAAPKPFQFTVYSPIQLIEDDRVLHGMRINLIYGVHKEEMVGLDLGFINVHEAHFKGIAFGVVNQNHALETSGHSFGFVNLADGALTGSQFSLVNRATIRLTGAQVGFLNMSGYMTGAQIGVVNKCDKMQGFQFGFMNRCDELDGLQLGLFNITRLNGILPIMPLVNASF